jgi:F420-non-reducing hydrogenase iron-sulfur subunit
MCSGRVDLDFILKAFSVGHDGVLIGGCKLNECNYITNGNYDALANTFISKKILECIGINPNRLTIEFMSGGEGIRLAESVNLITETVKTIGPLGEAEGLSSIDLTSRLQAARRLVPYLKLAERERLRVPVRSEAAYEAFFQSEEFDRLFDEIFLEKWAISRIMQLLEENPLSTSEIAATLDLSPSNVSKHMKSGSRHGWVQYDIETNCYTLT